MLILSVGKNVRISPNCILLANILNKIGTKWKNTRKVPGCFIQRLPAIAYGFYKTLNYLNPNFMKIYIYIYIYIFYRSQNVIRRKGNLYVHSQNTPNFGNKSSGQLGLTYGSHGLEKSGSKH